MHGKINNSLDNYYECDVGNRYTQETLFGSFEDVFMKIKSGF